MRKKNSDAFGPILRQFRNEKDLTQDELSEKIGVASSYVSMMESSQKYPNIEMLFKIAEALDVKPSVLIGAMEERLK